MKKVVAVLALTMVGMAAHADFYINFKSSFGIYNEAGDAGIIPNVGDQALVQLIYAGANDQPDYASGTDLSVGSLIAGDDVLLWQGVFTNNGGAYEDYASGTFNSSVIEDYQGNGIIYGRIFSGLGEVGDTYYQGDLFTANNLDPNGEPPPTPDDYDLGGAQDNQKADDGTVIPEPATFGLMGVAALGLFLARKKVRR